MAQMHSHPLPECFRDSPGLSEAMKALREAVLGNLKAEAEVPCMLDLLMQERVSYLYAHIRFKEQTVGFANDRAYKETTQLLFQMIESLRKKASREQIQGELKGELLKSVVVAVKEAMEFLPTPQRTAVMQNLADLLEAN